MPRTNERATQRRFFLSSHMDERGPFKRERRRQLEAVELHPPRIRISARLNGWLVDEVLAWETLLTAGVTGDAMRRAIRAMVAARQSGAKTSLGEASSAEQPVSREIQSDSRSTVVLESEVDFGVAERIAASRGVE